MSKSGDKKNERRKALYDDLEGMLRERLAERPEDARLHIRLAELYYEAGREDAFLRQAQTVRNLYRGNLDSTDWQQLATIGRRVAPESPLFDTGQPARALDASRRLGDTHGAKPYFDPSTSATTS